MPFWFAVEPIVSTKRDTCGGRRRSSSATRRAVGNVALLDAVENAVSIASRAPRKNVLGRMPPSHQTDAEYTPNCWIASPRTTTTT